MGGRTDGCRVKDVEDREDEVLMWGVPVRLYAELKHLAHSGFLLIPSLGPTRFFLPFFSNRLKHKASAKCQSRNFPSLYATLACNCDFL